MKVNEFNYDLPEELIAQCPCKERTGSRLLCVNRNEGTIGHKKFIDIIDHFSSGDVLVLNNTKVIPARLFGEKISTGAKIEVLLLERIFSRSIQDENVSAKIVERWKVLLNPSRRIKVGDKIVFNHECDLEELFYAVIPHEDAELSGMERIIDLYSTDSVRDDLLKYGTVPLPPYIKRRAEDNDKTSYQTVYADKEGAIAAPTAGLHFDENMLIALRGKGVHICFITLHVSYGTFKPIKGDYVKDHVMHTERVEISEKTATIINDAKAEGRRVIACGTTTVRAIESAVEVGAFVASGARSTNLFIYPSFEFKVIDGLITNFHLPKSSLFMLVCAWGGTRLIKKAYQEAVQGKYRFYSYGDAMFIY